MRLPDCSKWGDGGQNRTRGGVGFRANCSTIGAKKAYPALVSFHPPILLILPLIYRFKSLNPPKKRILSIDNKKVAFR
jgi:hypothetical protein